MSEAKFKFLKDAITWQVFLWVMAGVFCLCMLAVKTSMEAKASATKAEAMAESNYNELKTDIGWIKTNLTDIKTILNKNGGVR